MTGNCLMVNLPGPLITRRWGAVGDGIPDVLQSTIFSTAYSSTVQDGVLPQFLADLANG